MEIDNFLELLSDFESLPNQFNSKSIFDITGYPHHENVSSNILAFYLNPNNEHGLGSLFFSSLMSFATEDEPSQDNMQISREVSTIKKGRIDIVIETDSHIIGIENKIFHHLNNDLEDYSNSINEWAKPEKLETIKIVLGIKKEESHGFVSVTYQELWAKIREQLGNYVTTTSQKWILYLIDFMNTTDNLIGGTMELDEKDQFFIEHEERVNELLKARNKFLYKFHCRVSELKNLIDQVPDCCNRQWIHARRCLVHDFDLAGYSIAFDLFVSPKGWSLQLFGRNTDSINYLDKLLHISPVSDDRKNMGRVGFKYELEKFELHIKLEEIKEKLLNWFERLIESENNLREQSE